MGRKILLPIPCCYAFTIWQAGSCGSFLRSRHPISQVEKTVFTHRCLWGLADQIQGSGVCTVVPRSLLAPFGLADKEQLTWNGGGAIGAARLYINITY